MYQTGYKGYTTLAKGLPYNGGFCKWYYIARQQLLSFPPVSPQTQYLSAEPAISGSWCGPVIVPRDTLGFEEKMKRSAAGFYYQYVVSGTHTGDDRINFENMPYYQFVVVGKLRAGGAHLILGNVKNGLQFDADFKTTGSGAAGAEFSFTGDFLHKAVVLPSFLGASIIVPPVGGGSGPVTSPFGTDAEIFSYSTEDQLQVPYTAELKKRFGKFPVVEVWYTEEETLRLNANAVITVDAFPPDTSLFTITLNAPGPGIVVFK